MQFKFYAISKEIQNNINLDKSIVSSIYKNKPIRPALLKEEATTKNNIKLISYKLKVEVYRAKTIEQSLKSARL